MQDCLFCKIINGEIPSYKIYEDDHTYAFLDISNDCLGHTLVIPKVHSENIFDTSNETLSHVIQTTKILSTNYKALGFEGVNIQNNSGAVAGQSVFHLHFHILPRGRNESIKKKIILDHGKLDLSTVCAFLSKKICRN